MATAAVQTTGAQSSGNVASISKAFASNVTAGSALFVCATGFNNSAAPTFTVTDSKGQTYTAVASSRVTSGNAAAQWFVCANAASGATTVTVTPSANSTMVIGVHERSGADTSAPAGQATTGSGSSTTPAASNMTLSGTEDAVLCWASDTAVASATFGAGTGFTSGYAVAGNGFTSAGGIAEYKDGASGTVSPAATRSASGSWLATAVAAKAAGGGGGATGAGLLCLLGCGA